MNYSAPVRYNDNPLTSSRKAKKFGKNVFWSLLCPAIMLVLALILSYSNGTGLFLAGTTMDTLSKTFSILKMMVMTLIAALALNTNLNSGRMDFALGATGMLACVFSFLCIGCDLSTIQNIFTFVLLAIVFGMLLGLVHAIVLILLKLPPIVVSLGMCLVYEGIAKVVVNGYNDAGTLTLKVGQYTGTFFQEPIILLPLLAIVMLFMSAALCYTRFGYNKLALVYNQKISVETGINEISHCVASFIIAGALIAIYQAMEYTTRTNVSISTNLTSSSAVFKNFLPIFIGGILAKYSNQTVGLLLGVFATTVLYSNGFNNAGMAAVVSSLLNGFSVFAVLVYMVDKNRFINWVKMKRYLAKEKYLTPAKKEDVQ